MPDVEQPILSRLRPPKGAVRKAKRKGRGPGSGLGKTAGKGQKGQKARSPGDFGKLGFEGGQMPLQRRLPKVGFRNPFARNWAVVNLVDLERFDAGSSIDQAALKEFGVIRGGAKGLKVLGNGELTRALTVRANGFSASAVQKIEKAGGKVELIKPKADAADGAKARTPTDAS